MSRLMVLDPGAMPHPMKAIAMAVRRIGFLIWNRSAIVASNGHRTA